MTVEFTLQQRLANPGFGQNNEWQNTDNKHEINGWLSEILTQTFSETFPKYDSQGRELEYRWVESNVTLGDQKTNFTSNDKGGGTFTLSLENIEGEQEQLNFTSTLDEETNTITNRFDNTTYERVDKFWQQPDGTLAQIKPADDGYPQYPDLDTSGKVMMDLFQDGVLIGSFEMDGTVDSDWTTISNLGQDVRVMETSSYHLEFENLPKYDEGGVRYTYLVLEQAPSGWHAERTYDADTHTTRIENTVGPGEGSEIRLIKNWNDGDDASHRLPVVVDLIATTSMTAKQNIDPATDELYHYEAGDVVVSNITLSADNSWFAEVDVPIGDVSYKQFRIVEKYLIGDDGTQYPIVSGANNGADAQTAYADKGISTDWINIGWDYESTENTYRVATEDHVYQVSGTPTATEGEYNDAMRAVTATNRRLGLIDIDITKIWNDGVDHANRPKAELVLSCTEYADAFSIDAEGKAWVQVSENRIPVLDAEGEQLTTADSVRIENIDGSQALVMTMEPDLTQSKFTYAFHGLPKYDNSGNVVHYDVSERWAPGENADEYTSTKEVGGYIVGTQHFHDTQAYEFTNTRYAMRSVVFHKHWSDQYVNDHLKQRPDIYLTLYRMTVERGADGAVIYSDPEPVDDYVNWLWAGAQGSEDAQYDQTCSIANMPSYDSNGNEYVYFATESMSADGSSLDYTPVTFRDTFTDANGANMDINGDPEAVNIQTNATNNDPASIEDGSNWAIHEGGTFVNKLTDNLVARGTKLWENVPGNVAQADLPELTVYIQQRVAGDQGWPSLKFETDNEGNWQFADDTNAIAWTSDLVSQGNNQYTYRLAYTGENTEEGVTAALVEDSPTLPEGAELLPRYTEDGELYEYRAIEVPWGLLNQPGGPTTEFINTTDFCELRDSDDDSIGIYVIEHGETGSFLLRNIYTSDTGSLTVQKHYTGRETGDLYPATTFDVYRYYISDKGVKSAAALVDSVTLTNDMLKQGAAQTPGLAVTGAGEAATTAQYTFSGLDIYAPDGSYWQYYVVEHNINGYKTTVNVGNVAAENVNGTGEAVEGGVSSGALCPEQGTVEAPELGGSNTGAATSEVTGTVLAKDQVAADGAVTPGDTTPDVTFKNEYTPESIELTGTKTWDDYNGMFNMRPTVGQFWDGLTVEQIGNNQTINLKDKKLLQNTTADNPYYYVLDETVGDNNYTVTISNLPKWAPDGTAYQYKITEDLNKMGIGNAGLTADNYYDAVTGEATVSASAENPSFALRNALRGSISVHKDWKDGEDPYGLRPTSVTVQLQARLVYHSAGGNTHTYPDDGSWKNARQLLLETGYATEDELLAAGINEDFIVRELRADNGWNASWTGLPMAGISEIPEYADELFTIEYRAVEIAIGDQEIEAPTANKPGSNGSIYGTYHPYQPSQEETGNADDGYHSEITNTLETTSISATKSWEGDVNGNTQDAWNTRPDGANGNWEVTYLLQQRLEGSGDEGWHWLMEYGAGQAAVDNPLAEGIVSQTITGNDQSKTVEWENLPDCDEKGTQYEYRVVEQVPGGYDVTDASAKLVAEATDNKGTATTTDDVIYRYYVVDSVEGGDAGDSQTFTNTLRTVNLTGTKEWDDFNTGVAPNIADKDFPTMTLYRAYKTGDTTYSQAQQVTYIYNNGQPVWTDANSDGVWEFAYNGLPAANADDKPYVYWAEETSGSAEGFYPLYGSTGNQNANGHDAAGTTVVTDAVAGTIGQQTNETITNVATRFTFDKVSDFTPEGQTEPEDLRDIELTIYGTGNASSTIYAVWKDVNGVVSSTVWPDGTTDPTTGGTEMTGDNAGFIVGLPAGTYTVKETGTVPVGYAKAPDVTITIANNGNVTATQSGNNGVLDVEGANPGGTITVNVEDPVLRGHLKLTKYVTDDGQVGGANQTAPADGYFNYTDSATADNHRVTSGNLTIDRTHLNPTLTGDNAVRNTPTSLEINKANDVGQGLAGAEFQIAAQDNSEFAQPSSFAAGTYDEATKTVTLTTDSTGHIELVRQLVVGGTYTIYESKAPSGYDPADAVLTVTVQEDGSLAVDGDLPERYAWADLDENGQADNAYSFMVTNIHEEIDILKVNDDGDALEGAEFTLAGVCMDKNTTHTYTTNEDGYIHVDAGLMGGVRYQLSETKPADGYTQLSESLYFMMDERGEIVVTDAQENPLDEADYPAGYTVNDNRISLTVKNDPVELQITKRAPDNEDGTPGETLPWAEFTITPVNGSKFAAGAHPTEAQTMRTGENGTLSMSAYLIVGGTYDITETKAPEGYEKVEGTMRVTVDNDGTIRVLGSVTDGQLAGQMPPTGYTRVDANKFEVQVVNEPIEIGIVKVDAHNTTTKLPGAVFEIVGEFAGSNETETREFKTNENGRIDIDTELKSGQTYQLTEKQAPDGYEHRTGTFEFTVGENGEVSIVGTAPDGYSVEQGNVTIVASDEPIEVGFVKKDLGDTNLAGGEFTLSGTFVNDTTHETAKLDIPFTSTDGTVSFAGLPYEGATYSLIAGQKYTLTENTAPAYYETLEPFTFSVDQDGKIAAAGDSAQAGEDKEGYVISEADGTIVLTAHDTPIEVTLAKTSSANKQLALPDAVFELYVGESAEGEPYADVSVGENGTIALENLIAGTTYTLHEVTAPAGYELLSDVTFTVEKDGTVTLQGAPEGYTVAEGEDGVVTFTAADTPIEAKLVKTDEAGTPLANAIFTVQGTFAGDYANETEITLSATDANGVVSIPSAALIANEQYTITEVTAPSGYELAGSVEFTVGTDGVISIVTDDDSNADGTTDSATETGATGAVDSSTTGEGATAESAAVAGKNGTGTYTASTDGDTAVISATDHLVEVTITKTDGGQGLLPGAEFTATATDSNNGSAAGHSVTATTGEDGMAVLSGLIAGQEYTLTETKAPAGYELLTDTLTFTVQADGTIDAGFFPPAAFAIGQAKDAVTVTDNPLEVTLVKQAPNGAPLAGAEFRVEGEFPDGQMEKMFTSDENGIVFHQLQLIGSAEGTLYTVTETKVPEGYAQPSGSLDLLVFEDGTVQIADTSATDMKQNASVTESGGVAVITLNNEPLPGTELPQTGDNKILPLLAGAFGLLGLWAIVMGTVAYRRFRTKGEE